MAKGRKGTGAKKRPAAKKAAPKAAVRRPEEPPRPSQPQQPQLPTAQPESPPPWAAK